MIENNVSLFKLSSLQKLVNNVSTNKILNPSAHNSSINTKEYLTIFYENQKSTLISSVAKYKYFSVMIDDSIDIRTINQMSVFIRFIDHSDTVKTKFLALKEIRTMATSENLFKILVSVLEEFQLDFKNLVGLCGDGGKNISGNKRGLSGLIRLKNQYLITVHCFSHQFNLIIKNLFKNDELNDIKNKIYKITKYINSTSKRLNLFYNIQKELFPNKKRKKIIAAIDIRWSSLYNCIHSIVENFEVIKIFFQRLDLNKKLEEINEFINLCEDTEFVVNIITLDKILNIMNIGILNLQKENLNVDDGKTIIFNTIAKLEDLKNDEIIKKIYEKIELIIQNNNNNNSLLNIKKKIKKNVDFIITEIKTRFNKQKESLLEKIIQIFNPIQIKEYLNESKIDLKQTYISTIQEFKPLFCENHYNDRSEDFRIFMETISASINILNNCTDVCKFVLSKSTLGNCVTLIRLAQIYLLIPITTVGVERGFSCLNIIKSKQRNNLNQTSLNSLMMTKINLSDENAKELIEKSAEDWVNKKQRRTANYSVNDVNRKIYYKNYEVKTRKKIEDEERISFQGLELANEFENKITVENKITIENKEKKNEIENFSRIKIKRKRTQTQNTGEMMENDILKKGFQKKVIKIDIY
jgi:hypothetical protein